MGTASAWCYEYNCIGYIQCCEIRLESLYRYRVMQCLLKLLH